MLASTFLPLFASLAASASIAERSIKTGLSLYAYGDGINGFLVYTDSNSTAVIADNTTAVAQGFNNITWSIDTTGAKPWNVTVASSSSTGSFYIVPTTDQYQKAGFTVNTTAPTGAANTGFVLYGSTVEYATGTTYESQFYAQNGTTGVWSLMWNTNSTAQEGGVPVVLKTLAPVAPTVT